MRLRRGRHNDRGDRGLTLLELVVAVMVLAIGSIAALQTMNRARASIGGGAERVLATLAADNRVQELRLVGDTQTLPATVELGARSFSIRTDLQATAGGLLRGEVRAVVPGGAGALRITYVAPVQP